MSTEAARISVCGVMEYPCHCGCGDWIREHEAIWATEDGHVQVTGGHPYTPGCLPMSRRSAPARRPAA